MVDPCGPYDLSFNSCVGLSRLGLGLSGVSRDGGGHRLSWSGVSCELIPDEWRAVAVAFIMAWGDAGGGGPACDAGRVLAGFRRELHACFTARADALFELCDAALCAGGRVTDLARLSLAPEFRRGHGALYGAVSRGRVSFARLRMAVAGLPLPAWPDGGIRLAVDVSAWLRPEAAASPERMFCHVHGRGANPGQKIPGWPYSLVSALGPGPSSWQALLDAVRIGPGDDETDLTAAQLREVIGRLAAAGRWRPGDPPVLVVMDAGYNPVRLAWLLRDLPVVVCARLRAGRVFYPPAPPRDPSVPGRVPKHTGTPVRCAAGAGEQGAAVRAGAVTRHGPAAVTAWHRMHQKLVRPGTGWASHPRDQQLPVIEGTLIRLAGARKDMWLRASEPAADAARTARLWQAYLRRFDIEHCFRFLKQHLGWTAPLLRDPAAADRWTWIVIAAWNQLWLARPLAAAVRLPWQPAVPAGEMTPGRVRAAFRCARETAGTPASPPKPASPGPGRPKGSKNARKPPRHPVGKRNRKHPKPAPKTATG
jgi:DDE superfamily endonuclease